MKQKATEGYKTEKLHLAKKDRALKMVGVWERTTAKDGICFLSVLLSRNKLFATVKHRPLGLKEFRQKQ